MNGKLMTQTFWPRTAVPQLPYMGCLKCTIFKLAFVWHVAFCCTRACRTATSRFSVRHVASGGRRAIRGEAAIPHKSYESVVTWSLLSKCKSTLDAWDLKRPLAAAELGPWSTFILKSQITNNMPSFRVPKTSYDQCASNFALHERRNGKQHQW